MSTFVLMKILESTPYRYDGGIRLLTWGRLDDTYDRLLQSIQPGHRVLDIGCGTGALTIKAAQKGAQVKAIDINPEMIEIARDKIREKTMSLIPHFAEMGIAELGTEEDASYDVVMSGLCFSELSEDELRFTLKESVRILKSGGLLLVADEVNPDSILHRFLINLIRLPLVVLTYILTQTTTGGVKNLPEEATTAGFVVESIRLNRLKDFMELIARKPKPGEK